MKIFIIGCGGVGSWLAGCMTRLVKGENVILIDGDTLEQKNLDRQMFSDFDIGKNKSKALAKLLGCDYIPEWYHIGLTPHAQDDVLMVAVDNNPARVEALNACDFTGCSAIFGANETHSAEAYIYLPHYRGQPTDPRNYYPHITEVKDGDPRAASIGCTGESQQANVQLVTANFMAAALMQKMFCMHFMVGRHLDADVKAQLPFKIVSNMGRFETHKPAVQP